VECVILIGLQGAGKTSLFQSRFAGTHVHVSMDRFPSARDKAARQAREIDLAFQAGRSVVVDNTNPSIAVRAPIIRAGRAHGARVIGYYFDVTTREAVARNRERDARSRVPNVAIFTTARRLERPTLAEGFDELWRVQVQREGPFTITPLDGE
jgi:predicted kinase